MGDPRDETPAFIRDALREAPHGREAHRLSGSLDVPDVGAVQPGRVAKLGPRPARNTRADLIRHRTIAMYMASDTRSSAGVRSPTACQARRGRRPVVHPGHEQDAGGGHVECAGQEQAVYGAVGGLHHRGDEHALGARR